MNFSRSNIQKELKSSRVFSRKLNTSVILNAVKICILAVILVIAIIGFFMYGTIKGIIDTAPNAANLSVTPLGVATSVYDTDNNLIATLVTSGSNREPVSYDRVPQYLKDAFVAIEDSRFWTHEGVDIRGILRAGSSVFTGKNVTGASTITQQLLKNNVFDGGMEKGWGARFIRKFQEQYLALELEKNMSKEDILINYMNTINLGSSCLGVQKAANRYFAKDVSELTLSECAAIAGITQNPYRYNPITHPDDNREKRAIVLDYMEEQGKISAEEKAQALADTDDMYARIQEVNKQIEADYAPYSYFVDELISQVLRDLQNKLGYSESDAYSLLYSGGLKIYSTQNPAIQSILDEEINNEDNYPSNADKWSFTYELYVTHADETTTYYSHNSLRSALNYSDLVFKSKDSIQAAIDKYKSMILQEGDTITSEKIFYTMEPQVSAVIMDQSNGQVVALNGGRGEKQTNLSWNRATDTYRSPGSTFKILAAYAPMLDTGGGTLATPKYDEPYYLGQANIGNWWGRNLYLGYCNARQGIVASINIVTIKYMMENVGIETAFQYCENFGITTLVRSENINGSTYSDLGPTLCIGGLTKGVNCLELTAAYAAIANKGVYNEPVLYSKILDYDGNLFFDNVPESHQVLKSSTAFLITDALHDAVKPYKIKGQSAVSSSFNSSYVSGVAAAAKTGTSTDSNGKSRDLWFVGYTPYYTMGIWTGFDDGSVPVQGNVSSVSYHKNIWREVMTRLHNGLPSTEFEVPDDVVMVKVCSISGKLPIDGVCNSAHNSEVHYEYFAKGTEPTEKCDLHVPVKVCAESGKLPAAYCTNITTKTFLKLPDKTTGSTIDTPYGSKTMGTCDLHANAPVQTPPETNSPDTSGETTAPPAETPAPPAETPAPPAGN